MTFLCRSRYQDPHQRPGTDEWVTMPNGDHTCSYCGSLREDDFMAIVQGYAENKPGFKFNPSTKNYKTYAFAPGVQNASQGGIKFYGWHVETEPDSDQGKNYQRIYQIAMNRYEDDWNVILKGKTCR